MIHQKEFDFLIIDCHSKYIVRCAQQESWEQFINTIKQDLHGKQELAYTFLKMMGQENREHMRLQCVSKRSEQEHYAAL